MKKTIIHPWESSDIQSVQYDLFICTIGPEGRSRYVATKFAINANLRVAYGLAEEQEFEYERNLKFYAKRGFQVITGNDASFDDWCKRHIAVPDRGGLKILADISSMSRSRIASLIAAGMRSGSNIVLDAAYANAKFVKPSADLAAANTEPICEDFAGWPNEPDRLLAVVLGLGYERDKAIGALEYLQPAIAWAFETYGLHGRFKKDVIKANHVLYGEIPDSRKIQYNILDPFACFELLESLAHGALNAHRVVFVPLGPKIFTLTCLAVASMYHPQIGVWRVRSAIREASVNRQASGEVVGLRVEFRPSVSPPSTEAS